MGQFYSFGLPIADSHGGQQRVDSGSSAATGKSRPTPVIDGPEMTARKRPFDAEVIIVAMLQGIRDHTSK